MPPNRIPGETTGGSDSVAVSNSTDTIIPSGSLEAVQDTGALAETRIPDLRPPRSKAWIWKTAVVVAVCGILAGGGALALRRGQSNQSRLQSGDFAITKVSLADLGKYNHVHLGTGQVLHVNGVLQVAGSLVLNPGSQPTNPQVGQLYYDKITNRLSYYDGQDFQIVGTGASSGNVISNITNILSGVGNGVQLQAATPGSQQIGNFNISGTGTVGRLDTTVIDSQGGTFYINPVSSTAQQSIAVGTPATAGLSVVGSTVGPPNSGWHSDLSGTKITMGNVGGTSTAISVYFNGGTVGDHVQVGLYEDNGDVPSKPGAQLAASASVLLTPNGFTTVPIPSVALNANTTYWLAVNTDSNTVGRAYNGGSKASCFKSSTYGFMPDPFQTTGCFYDDNVYSIYLNYLLGAGTSGSLSSAAMAIGANGQALFQNSADSNTAFQVQNAAGTSTIFNIDTLNGRVSIGKASAQYKLDIAGGDINISNGHSIRFSGLQVLNSNADASIISVTNFMPGGMVAVQADGGFAVRNADTLYTYLNINSNGEATFTNKANSSTAFQIQNADGSATILSVDTSAKTVHVSNLAISGHITTSGTTPAIAAGAAACTTPTVTVTGNDTSGTISVVTGTGCGTNGTLATLTFGTAFAGAPRVLLTPGNAAALSLGSYVNNGTASGTSVSIGTNTTPTGSTTYIWNYWITQ
ncbi:MAG TPA: hypothetical protein VLF59_03125 [Candidatus Saccharimonadales bacterium]|nr:hypothetical protein [Candidatus Saccharimonadales bacterium]